MADMQMNIMADKELVTEAQIMLKERGLDLKIAFDSFLKDIIEMKSKNTNISPNNNQKTNIDQLLECAGMFDDETTKEILSAIEDCKKIDLEAWNEVFD
ncbi:MAG: hypothetical protein FWG98_03430 [Candidatus Cloacimonetes bacterium]|nr:hypothetical protein [Candidatus Cloacimonadota bacterium]